MTIPEAIGWLKHEGFTYGLIAQACHVSPNTLTTWVHGRCEPKHNWQRHRILKTASIIQRMRT